MGIAPETQAYLDTLPADERAKIPAAVIDPTVVSSHTEPETYVAAVERGDLTPDQVMEQRALPNVLGQEFHDSDGPVMEMPPQDVPAEEEAAEES